jgi:putative endonuclease
MSSQGWCVYLLRCVDGTLYCGITNHMDRRLGAHGRGKVKYTRGRLPVALAWVEPAADKGAALRAEAAWKRLTRKQKLAAIEKKRAMIPDTCVFRAATVSHKHAEALPAARARRKRL